MSTAEGTDEALVPIGDVLAALDAHRDHAADDAARNLLRRQMQSLPSALDSERAILGGILLDGPVPLRTALEEGLEAGDFYREAHNTIFAAMVALDERAEPVDVLTVVNELQRRGDLDKVGGAASLAQLEALLPTSAHVQAYARTVREYAQRRRIIEHAHTVASMAYAGREAPSTIARYAETSLITIQVSTRSAWRALLDKARRALDAEGVSRRRWDEPMGRSALEMATGLHRPVPWVVQGIIRERGVHVSGAPPKAGKTWEGWEFLIAVASGTPAFGEFQVRTPGRGLAVCLEDDVRDLQVRSKALTTGRRMTLEQALGRIDFEARGTLDLLNLDDCAGVVASIWHHEQRTDEKIVLTYIDPLRDANTGKENDNDDARRLMHNVRAMRNVAVTAFYIQHHMAKPVEQRGQVQGSIFDAFRGAGALRGAYDGGIGKRIKFRSPNCIKSVVEVETRGGRGAGVFGLQLDISDDDDGNAVSAGWAFYRDASELDPPAKGGKAATQAERKDAALDATRAWLKRALASDVAAGRDARRWSAAHIAKELGRKDQTATWRHLAKLAEDGEALFISAGKHSGYRAIDPTGASED